MRLTHLIQDLHIECKGNKDIEIIGLSMNSKHVTWGYLFFANKGCHERYIEEAVANGALAVVTEIYNPFLSCLQLITQDVASIQREIASRFFQRPADLLKMVGITGTNGKTTTAYLFKQLMETKMLTGLIGTIEVLIDQRSLPSERTTPDSLTSQKYLKEMVKRGCRACVMEVSSHGLVQNRLELISFDYAVFTNLTQDHLDFHKTLEDYFLAKMRFFSLLKKGGVAVCEVSMKDKVCPFVEKDLFCFGFDPKAELRAENVESDFQESRFDLVYQDKKVKIELPLIAEHNILNFLAAASCCILEGFSLEELAKLAKNLIAPKGRLEKIGRVYIDYAHTPDALQRVLCCLQILKKKKLIVVFGCGGDRDREKRALMGKIASLYADAAILTNDNPRSEDPSSILNQIASGFTRPNYRIIADRSYAIKEAIVTADKEDLILIAGKGHESGQIFADKTFPFDDKQEVQKWIR